MFYGDIFRWFHSMLRMNPTTYHVDLIVKKEVYPLIDYARASANHSKYRHHLLDSSYHLIVHLLFYPHSSLWDTLGRVYDFTY
jgi:hypothetical protein